MIAHLESGSVEHAIFRDLPRSLRPGDALVVNVSRTIPASIEAETEDGQALRAHFASPATGGSGPWRCARLVGEVARLQGRPCSRKP